MPLKHANTNNTESCMLICWNEIPNCYIEVIIIYNCKADLSDLHSLILWVIVKYGAKFKHIGLYETANMPLLSLFLFGINTFYDIMSLIFILHWTASV